MGYIKHRFLLSSYSPNSPPVLPIPPLQQSIAANYNGLLKEELHETTNTKHVMFLHSPSAAATKITKTWLLPQRSLGQIKRRKTILYSSIPRHETS